jgi:DNA-binding Lrp family transcriptional regulator
MNADASLLAARTFSRVLFGGARYRLEVGAAIARESFVSTSGLADRLGLSRQAVNHELHLLERAGLLDRAPAINGERAVYFAAKESPYWAFCSDAMSRAAEWAEEPQSGY